MQSNVLALIPARGGSKGVPRKNIKPLNGRPLIDYVFRAATRSKRIDELILSTDDEEIAATGRKLGMNVPFIRPSKLAKDKALLPHVAKHALDYFREQGRTFEAIMTIQPTCPFLSPESINKAVDMWRQTRCDSVTTVSAVTKGHPHILQRVLENGRIEYMFPVDPESRGTRQMREKAYYLTGGLYLRDVRLFKEYEIVPHFLGNNARAVVVNEVEAVDVNTKLDFAFASFLVETGRVKL